MSGCFCSNPGGTAVNDYRPRGYVASGIFLSGERPSNLKENGGKQDEKD